MSNYNTHCHLILYTRMHDAVQLKVLPTQVWQQNRQYYIRNLGTGQLLVPFVDHGHYVAIAEWARRRVVEQPSINALLVENVAAWQLAKIGCDVQVLVGNLAWRSKRVVANAASGKPCLEDHGWYGKTRVVDGPAGYDPPLLLLSAFVFHPRVY